jgi:hypothetical protein
MGRTKLSVFGCVTALILLSASPIRAIHEQDLSYDGCDLELDWQPTWRDCPRSFDAATPQQIRKQINAAGLACVKPKSVGGTSDGGKFLQCTIGDQPITILSWPKPDGLKRYIASSAFNTAWAKPHLEKLKWAGCGAFELVTPRYMIWVPAVDANLKPNSEVIVNLRRALGLPKYGKYVENTPQHRWYTGTWTPRVKGALQACGH